MADHNKIGKALTLKVKDELEQEYRMYCKCNE
jgi:hypothetical protein